MVWLISQEPGRKKKKKKTETFEMKSFVEG